ncbi:transposase InsO family protein [Convivina intestini]|uniref:Transposase InsO family protein n=2 Tax=Convivina intestini TaxID=1505726 RepID=A0A2U1D2U6_9LACO|nr:transposase InsO family protein [Convivina intestini]CAH1857603.1 Putative transposase InsK for insertion sequence element IS150 [Convivina intestini]
MAIRNNANLVAAESLGYRPMQVYLNHLRAKRGQGPINHKRLRRIMREHDLQSKSYAKRQAKYRSYQGTTGRIYKNYLKKRFQTDRPLQKIGTDIAEFRWGEQSTRQRLFGSLMIDFYSGEILGYHFSLHPTTELVMTSLTPVLAQIQDLSHLVTLHSDQGTQYQSSRYQLALKQAHIRQSMSRKSTPTDNAVVESIIHQIKVGTVLNHTYPTQVALEEALVRWIYSYNHYRIRRKNNWLTPIAMRTQYQKQKVA